MLDIDVEFCPHCGEELNYVGGTCPDCGSDVPADAEYCPGCGVPIEQEYYVCSRCLEEITEAEVAALNAMPEDGRAKHIHGLNKAFEEREKQRETEIEQREKQREIERKEYRKIQAQKDREEAELVKEVEALLAGNVDTIKSVKITAAWIETAFIKDGHTCKLSVLKKDWHTALPRLLDSLNQFPSDVNSYKFERWS